jgi:hypothetical protein
VSAVGPLGAVDASGVEVGAEIGGLGGSENTEKNYDQDGSLDRRQRLVLGMRLINRR